MKRRGKTWGEEEGKEKENEENVDDKVESAV